VVERLDLRAFEQDYEEEGWPAYAPALMVKVWLYAYALGVICKDVESSKGIRANMISPEPVETPILQGQFGENTDAIRERFKTMIPMRRLGRARRDCGGRSVPSFG
jgi:NAD(P)-dependent dehydrogenase (short-subunit alcohol dehydrogenase family)